MATTNTLFALLAVSNPVEMETRLSEISPWLSLKVAEGQWLVIAPNSTTTQELSARLGITEGEVSSAIVLRVENYYGRSSVATWEWIAAKIGVALDPSAV